MNDDRRSVKCWECGWKGHARAGELVRCPECGEFAAEVVETVVKGPFLFPLRRYSKRPVAFSAAILWNTCERLHIKQPWGEQKLFDVIIGSQGKPKDPP